MKTKNIFKALAFALLVTTACNKNEIANDENFAEKGYALPVTINVSRQGDDLATRATFNDGTKKISFSTGDKLLVSGTDGTAGQFAGTLTWQSEGTFSGTLLTENAYSGTADELLEAASTKDATLLPAGYEPYGFLYINNEGTYSAYVSTDYDNAFATSKAAAVEQFSCESSGIYSCGFALAPESAILNFTITGLTASTEVAVAFSGECSVSGTVTTDGSGNATFAVGVMGDYTDLNGISLKVGGNAIALSLPAQTAAAGKIYNITRSATGNTIDLSTVSKATIAQNGDVLKGTLANNVKISIADGATVILNGVTINGTNNISYSWAGITCLGDATIVLSGSNTAKGFYEDYPGIHVPSGKTVTIQGTGSLTASSNGFGAGIGGGYDINCGNITIAGGTINATGRGNSAGIGCGDGSCGNILITGGTITATGSNTSAGIGGNSNKTCGSITIANTVTSVTATKGNNALSSIGKGDKGVCGTVTIGGTVYWDGSAYQNDGETYLTQATITYPAPPAPPAATGHVLSASAVGEVVGTDGLAYDVADKDNLPTGVTAAGIVAYKSGSNGLVTALTDDGSMNWSTANGATTGAAAHTPAVTGQAWKLPSEAEWKQMFSANGGNEGSRTGLNTAITNAGGTALDKYVFYWSSTENNPGVTAYSWVDYGEGVTWGPESEGESNRVRACLAF